MAAKEATPEATSDTAPLVAGEADEEQSHSFRSYKINEDLYTSLSGEQNITHLLFLP